MSETISVLGAVLAVALPLAGVLMAAGAAHPRPVRATASRPTRR